MWRRPELSSAWEVEKNSDSSFTWNTDNTIMMICWEAQAVCWSPRFVCFCLFVLFVASQSRTTGQPLEYFHFKLWLHYAISPKSQGWKRYSRKTNTAFNNSKNYYFFNIHIHYEFHSASWQKHWLWWPSCLKVLLNWLLSSRWVITISSFAEFIIGSNKKRTQKGVGFKGPVLLKLHIENTNYCKTLCLTLTQRLSHLLYFQRSKFNEMVGAFKPFVFQNVPLVYDGDDDMCCRNAPTMEGTLLDVQCGRVSCDEFAVTPAGSGMHLVSYLHYLSECGVCTVSGLKHWPGIFAYPQQKQFCVCLCKCKGLHT